MAIAFLIFLAALLLLVISHEAGHFFAARAFGIKVEEFGFGIPPRIFGLWRGKRGTPFFFEPSAFRRVCENFWRGGKRSFQPAKFRFQTGFGARPRAFKRRFGECIFGVYFICFCKWFGCYGSGFRRRGGALSGRKDNDFGSCPELAGGECGHTNRRQSRRL